MFFPTLTTFSTLLLATTAFAAPTPSDLGSTDVTLFNRAAKVTTRATTCATGAHLIVVRGSLELPGDGQMAPIAASIIAQYPGSDQEALVYEAGLVDYPTSEANGVYAFYSLYESYVAKCPETKIVLIGYSQGAAIIGDSLCGTDSLLALEDAPLPTQYTKNIAAVAVFGDPGHVVGQPQNVGTSTRDGLFPRTNQTACAGYTTRSWCDHGDPFCDKGGNLFVHLNYENKYGVDAATWVVSKLK